MLALLSGLVLITTGYAWATVRDLDATVSTNDLIGSSHPDGATDILLVGNDSRTDAQGNPLPDDVLRTLRAGDDGGSDNTDTMILVRIPYGGQRASAVSLPRDTLVRFGDDGQLHKLNSALATAAEQERERLQQQGVSDPKQREARAHAAGQRFLIKTVEDLTGAHIDHYAEVSMLGFAQITDAVGGVDVCLKHPVDDRAYSGAVFPAGRQTLRGADALAFVRQRHGLLHGDLDRVVRQQVFLSGLARKLLSTGTLADPVKLGRLMAVGRQSVTLDAGWDVLGFAQQMQGITGGNIDFHTIPVDLTGPSGHEAVDANVGKVHRFVADLLLDPAQWWAKQQQEAATQAKRARTTVNVYNGVGVAGLARSVLTTLGDQGFTQGNSDNTVPAVRTSVHYAPGDELAARDVAGTLGGMPIQASPTLEPGTVEVYLGGDYRGPGARSHDAPATLHGQMAQAIPRTPGPPITAAGMNCVD